MLMTAGHPGDGRGDGKGKGGVGGGGGFGGEWGMRVQLCSRQTKSTVFVVITME